MALDRWISVVFIVISLVYGYASYNYPLLPFERNMPFLPNTMPMILSLLGILFALIILFSPKAKPNAEGDTLGDISMSRLREYKLGQALGLIGSMILYALALRPLGFLVATTLFLVGLGVCATILRFADYPLPPLLIGFILGGMMENNFARAVNLTDGVAFVYERPMTLALLITGLLLIVLPAYRRRRRARDLQKGIAPGD